MSLSFFGRSNLFIETKAYSERFGSRYSLLQVNCGVFSMFERNCKMSIISCYCGKKIQPVDHQQIGLVVHYCFINQMNPGAYETCAFSLFSITVDMKFIVDRLFGYVIVIPKVTKVSSEALKHHSFNLNRLVHNNHNLEVSVFCLTRVKRTLESLCVIHVAYIKVTFCQPVIRKNDTAPPGLLVGTAGCA